MNINPLETFFYISATGMLVGIYTTVMSISKSLKGIEKELKAMSGR
jgi:hypothetical protein